jgi:hypothetical protein
MISLAFCLNRRIAVRRRLQRISKSHRIIGRGDVPKVSMWDLLFSKIDVFQDGTPIHLARIRPCLSCVTLGSTNCRLP